MNTRLHGEDFGRDLENDFSNVEGLSDYEPNSLYESSCYPCCGGDHYKMC